MGEVVAVVNQKGGVGKTSVTLGLASAAAAKGHKVLVVDMDPQGASSWVLGIDADRVEQSVGDVITSGRKGAGRSAIVPSRWGHLVDVIPALPDLQNLEVLRAGLDTVLLGAKNETRLRRGLNGVTDGYGVVLIDCPPSLGSLTTNALAAASQALLVVEPNALSLRGIDPVADLIEEVWDRHNQRLDLAGVVVYRPPARSHDAAEHLAHLDGIVGRKAVWTPYIPPRVAIAEAAASRRSIHAIGSRGADAAAVFDALYRRLWRVIKPARAQN